MLEKQLSLEVGSSITRKAVDGPDDTDIRFDIIKGSTFEVTQLNDGFITAKTINAPEIDRIGNTMSIPSRYLTSRYFAVG